MKVQRLIVLVLLMLGLAACARQTPGGGMEYSTAFERDIPVGKTLPGTDIKYIGKTDQGAQVSLGGQPSLKRMFDSLTWRGDFVPGVSVDYGLRILSYDADSLKVGGTAKIAIAHPNPKAVPTTTLPKDPLTFKGLLVTYSVPKGQPIPGTTITYESRTPDGARLGGVEGYPYRQEADSIVWVGQLADKTFLQLDLRVVFYNEGSLQLTGTPTLFLAP